MFHLQPELCKILGSETHYGPGDSQFNGMTERTIQAIKSVFHQTAASSRDPDLLLLELRNTSLTCMECCPVHLLVGRMLRTTLPSLHVLLQLKIPWRAHTRLKQQQERRNTMTIQLSHYLCSILEIQHAWKEHKVDNSNDGSYTSGAAILSHWNTYRRKVQT